jgi:glycosyltransferase involved in cell wall biosynthesis
VKFNILSLPRLLEFLREYGPDIIHVQNRQGLGFGRRLSEKLRVPHIVTVHRVPLADMPRLDHPLLAGVIAANEQIRETLVNAHGLAKSMIRVIPRGVDIDLLAPECGRDAPNCGGSYLPTFGSIGSLTALKGHDVFLRAARKVIDLGIDALFAAVGEGTEEKALRRLAASLKLEGKVTFSPHIPSRRDLFGLFDIVVVPTLRGGVGSTVLEAMSMGKPVIASAVGEILHIVQDQKTGLLVREGDADSLAERMVRLLRSPDLCRSLGVAARAEIVERFPLSAMVARTRAFYEEVLVRNAEGAVAPLRLDA